MKEPKPISWLEFPVPLEDDGLLLPPPANTSACWSTDDKKLGLLELMLLLKRTEADITIRLGRGEVDLDLALALVNNQSCYAHAWSSAWGLGLNPVPENSQN